MYVGFVLAILYNNIFVCTPLSFNRIIAAILMLPHLQHGITHSIINFQATE